MAHYLLRPRMLAAYRLESIQERLFLGDEADIRRDVRDGDIHQLLTTNDWLGTKKKIATARPYRESFGFKVPGSELDQIHPEPPTLYSQPGHVLTG